MGPIGSGKSVGCTAELFRRASEQEPHEGWRYTRWAIIRNTYRELVDTTIKTVFDWIPQQIGIFRQMDMKWSARLPLADGTRMDMEILFRALDKPDDVKKLLSLELTGAWINEAREVPKQVLDMLQGRVGRYPSTRAGAPTWSGVFMDTNPPDSDHWWYRLFEEDRPEGFVIFKQPSGVSPQAENLENLPADYYKRMMSGKTQEWINVYVHGKYGFISDGKPVYPEYQDDMHHSDLDAKIYGKIYVGIDFGLTPAAVISQIAPDGQYQIIDELVCEDMGAYNFGKLLKEKLSASPYKDCEIEIYGDPAGDSRAQTDETTPFQVLWSHGINVWPAPTNDFIIRQGTLSRKMQELTFTGRPAFCIYPKAQLTRKSFAGGYKYKRLQITGEARFQDVPDKNRYSHPGDAAQYGALGAYGIDSVVGGWSKQFVDYEQTNRLIV